ncbi:MAG: ATP-binding protein [Burkholderiales bacterium]|nr:ATP-binding protein [Burkholderiales bacterium]
MTEPTPPSARLPARHETLLRVASLACALVVVAATILHALQLRGALHTAAEGRLLTVSRILAKEANRTLLHTLGLIDQVDEMLRAEDGGPGTASRAGLEALLESLPSQQTLLRAIAVVGRDGRVIASSDRRHVGLDLSAFDFVRSAPDDGRLHLGMPKSGRGFAEDAREGSEYAFDGWITVSRVTVGRADRPSVVAVIGSSSWIGDLKYISSDEDLAFTMYRYDGVLLAGSDPAIAKRRTPHPIFTTFLPDRETGAFEDLPGDARRWMAHFDTTADFPVVVDVRMPRSVVVAGWERELIAPLLVMLVTLIALVLYTGMTARALRSRAHSEQQAATQERRLRNIVETAADGIVTVDAQGIVRDFNRAAETIFGVPATDAVGRPLAALLPDDEAAGAPATGDHAADPGAALERWRAAQTGFDAAGRARTLRTRRRDGHPVELQFAVSEVHDQGERLYTGIVRDVTEVRQADERFRTLFQRSGEPHLLFDRDGLVDCNDAAAMLLRAGGRDALLGRRLDELAPPTQPDATSAEVLEAATAQARADGVKRLVWTALALDGTEFPVEMTLTPIRLGDQDAMLVAWHDIAERERHERQLREARDAAESAASAKAKFLAMMSHELRTPMTGIIGMIDLLRDTRMTDEQGRLAEVLQGSARALLTVLNDVLDYSKIEAGKLQLEAIDFRPDAVVREVTALLAPSASQRGNNLSVRWPEGTVPALRGDPTRLRQVLFNLVGNAIKFTERGTITIVGRTRELEDGGVELAFAVSDTGVGIATDVLPTLFRPFQQADSSMTRRFGGTGLGLAICRHLVEAMGGTIDVDSQSGFGSTFRFSVRLEVAGAEPQAPRDATPSEAPKARGMRILFAEDNATNRLLVGTRLGRAAHRVDLVENGLQAVEAVRERDYDLVLMDMQMPELDGVGATRAIRALAGPRGRVPIVALTADALPEFRERCMSSGLDDYLTTPIDWPALERVLLRYARSSGAPSAEPPSAAPAMPQAPPPTDRVPSVDAVERPDAASVAVMQEDLGEDVWQLVAEVYWPKAGTDLDACVAAVAAGDAAARRAAAHSLKGASSSLGFEAVAAASAMLEHCDEAEAAATLATLRDAFAAARAGWAAQPVAG